MKKIFINSEEQFDLLIQKNNFVLFGGDYCPDCKIFDLLINKIQNNQAWKEITIYYLDVVLFPEIRQKAKIMSIPTLRFYKNGTIVDQLKIYEEKYFNNFLEKYKN